MAILSFFVMSSPCIEALTILVPSRLAPMRRVAGFSWRAHAVFALCGLTFELSGPLRWTAGPARGSITERTARALTAAVAGPLERRVRLAREVVESFDSADQASESKEQRDKASRSAA